ncbi:MAG: hypothetical protein JWM59_1626 [Verrucomicrobiales bacterium]|nr:hypothetical protein [Verrucomicrobiales bacterium]
MSATIPFLHSRHPMSFPITGPYATTGGIVIFARILSKIRLAAEGGLPDGYHIGVMPGNRTFDDRVCCFLGIKFEDLQARTLEGGSDEEVLEWAFRTGRRPDAEQIEVWNTFMKKRGWRDAASEGLEKSKAESGLGHRTDIVTFFDLMEVEEGRAS